MEPRRPELHLHDHLMEAGRVGAPLAPPPVPGPEHSSLTDAGVFAKVTLTTAAIVDVDHAER